MLNRWEALTSVLFALRRNVSEYAVHVPETNLRTLRCAGFSSLAVHIRSLTVTRE